ncbi:EamA family transporter RarD [Virgibacillus sp. AGTR]|uniref:EamA family transporter RarD n=1 Tax=Virgibacillus sp. AGTR TaxID=2812055 RepID=UPI0019629FE1|nr:EamA family transporter RarD [Virgibacillus sp. AGTR]MCC2252366.1 EamA family transporter RarD [Virgibacillus sp. AGTR]QRZ18612.1 EamA family transporter RarD [Virgibacillus sp. AGTR]
MNANQDRNGMIYTSSAYILWGFLPIYWKLLDHVSPGETLAHRIIWSFVFTFLLVLIMRKWSDFTKEWKELLHNKKKLFGISLATLVISLNWLIFIWAVNSNHVVQASLGYYINPLISILLGIIVLKEAFTFRQTISFILAGIGVLYLTISYGVFPWVSLLLAISFGLYGLLKKKVDIGPMIGLTIETMLILPFAIIYLAIYPDNAFQLHELFSSTNLLLMGAGVMTAIPLLLFASGAKRISLAMVGFLQYIAPTLMLLLGVFIYKEAFTSAHLIAFAFIWIALVNFMLTSYRRPLRKKHV